jgi:eukaryotic-like serine/threonine-protein kinase
MTDARTSMDARIGSTLGARYRLEARLASGGMAVVYRAADEVLGRTVAVKVMHHALTDDAGFVERFRREARSAARLNHPNVVTIHDTGEENGTLYIVMELVEGTSLRELLDRFGRLDLDTTRHVVSGVAAALDHAHAGGVVHRDVKPENVLLTSDGRVKVVDFGVAKALGDVRLTGDTAIATLAYVSPEQISSGEIDGRADVYALGVMTYEMLTGTLPFGGSTPAEVAGARLAHPVPSPGINPKVDGALAKATAVQADDRFAHAGELARALGDGALAHLTETAEVPAARERRTTAMPDARAPRVRRRRWPRVLLALAVLAAAGVAAVRFVPFTSKVPRVAGMTINGAKAALDRAGLRGGTITEVYDDRADRGRIVRSDPALGREIRRGRTVALFVSRGPEQLDIPNVVGAKLAEATSLLEASKFSVGDVIEAFSNDVPEGRVVKREPDVAAAKRGTAFDLVVSKGPELIAVPSVSGRDPGSAAAALRGAGFLSRRVDDYSETVAQGKVASTNPSGGTKAPKGSTITMVVSKGPKPFAMPRLVGMTLEAAKARAASLGLRVAHAYAVPGSGTASGQVQGQNPPAGAQVRRGTDVDLWYAT